MKIFSPSYKRARIVTTQKYLPSCKYVVAEFEADEYIAEGHDCWIVPDSAQGSVCKIRNYILDNSDEKELVIIDDDMSYIGRWNGSKSVRLDHDDVLEFIDHGFLMANDLDVKLWGMNIIGDKGSYREYTPFSMKSPILGPFQAFRNIDLRYDEDLPLKEDYDLSLQVLNKYRRTLRFNMYHYVCKQKTITGGCAAYRNIDFEKEQFKLLVKKWGSDIVRQDSGKSQTGRKKELVYDINPIIKVPIGGV